MIFQIADNICFAAIAAAAAFSIMYVAGFSVDQSLFCVYWSPALIPFRNIVNSLAGREIE